MLVYHKSSNNCNSDISSDLVSHSLGREISTLINNLTITTLCKSHSLVVIEVHSELLIVLLNNVGSSLLDSLSTHTTLKVCYKLETGAKRW